MKLSFFVFACLLAGVLATPIDPKLLKSETKTEKTTTPAPIGSTTTVNSTEAPTAVPSTSAAPSSTTSTSTIPSTSAAPSSKTSTSTVPSTSAASSTSVPSSTTVSSVKSKVSTDKSKVQAAPVMGNTKKSPEARKGRGSKKFNMVEKPEEKPVEKPKVEEKPKEATPENKPKQKPEEEPKKENAEKKKPEEKEEEEEEEEKQPEQKLKGVDEVENIPTVSGKIVPAIAQPRILSPEARSKGRKYKDIQIVQLESELEENGKYHFKYENEDGTIVHQSGEMKMMDHDGEKAMGESVEGAYSYKDDDGNTISVTYTADENGFRPVGAHIPTIPPAIARSLAWQATAKPWVDPWAVEQEELRKARKLSAKSKE